MVRRQLSFPAGGVVLGGVLNNSLLVLIAVTQVCYFNGYEMSILNNLFSVDFQHDFPFENFQAFVYFSFSTRQTNLTANSANMFLTSQLPGR